MKKSLRKRRALLLAVILLFIGYKYIDYTYFPLDPSDETPISFILKQGDNASRVAANLEKQKIIQSNFAFYLYIRRKGLASDLKAGRFMLSKNMSIPEIAVTLTNAGKAEGIVTIPEGFTAKDIDQRLTEQGLIKAGEFTKCIERLCNTKTPDYLAGKTLEGFLFPDTYFVNSAQFDTADFVQRLINTFDHKFSPEMRAEITKQNRSIYDVIKMASIIEKEVKTESDRKIVAGILWKRLDNGWTLGADATLLYGKDKNTISETDLIEDSPYNTRKHKGLPPTPIANPGLKSITAAIYPEKSPYWYYLTTRKGEVIYAITNDEHNANRAHYLQ